MSEKKEAMEKYVAFVTKLGSAHTMVDFLTKTGTMGLGLAGEAAEISDVAMKYGGGYPHLGDEDTRKLIDELGDICWYVAFAAGNVVDVPFDQLIPDDVPTLTETSPGQSIRPLSLQLSTSCGAVADIAKKLLYHGKPYTPEVRAKLIGHLQNVMINVLYIAKDVCRTEVQDVIDKNVAKLSERYKSLTFTTEEFMQKEAQAEEVAKDDLMRKEMGEK